MVDIEVRQAVVPPEVVVVEEALPAGHRAADADAGSGGLRVEALGPGIGRGEDHRAGALFELEVEGVVARNATPVTVDIDVEVGIWLAGQARAVAESLVARRAAEGGILHLQGLPDIPPHQQVRSLGADVADIDRRGRVQGPLDSESPLRHVGIAWLRRHADR